MDPLFEDSDRLYTELLGVINGLGPASDSERLQSAGLACSLSLEHWVSVRALLQGALLPSAVVVHRAQFEALTRSVWLTYAASDEHVAKFVADLSVEADRAAKNAPLVDRMLQQLAVKAPRPAYDGLARFREQNWRALNSYAHAGIHPLRRHLDGYPAPLLYHVLRNANGLAVFSCMQFVALAGQQPLQQQILDLAARHPQCTPPPG